MSHRQFFSRVLFCITILLGSMAPSFGMEELTTAAQSEGGLGGRLKGFWDMLKKKAYSNSQSSDNSQTLSINLQEKAEANGKVPSIFDDHKKLQKGKEEATEEVPSNINNDNDLNPNIQIPLNIDNGYGESIRDMESCFLNAPSVAKQIVALLKDPTHFVKTYRFALIVSGPGDGKTLLSKAIAYTAGWKCMFFPSCAFAGTARTETLKNMLHALHWIVESNEETVISIDEINRLADNAKNTNYDTAETATAIWNFIDAHKYNQKIYLIGTMNDATKIPQPLKQRAQGRVIRPQPLPLDAKREMLKDKIKEAKWELNVAECKDAFLEGILQAIPNLNARDIESIAYAAVAQAMESNNYQPIGQIEQRHFRGALEQVILDRQTMDYNREEESREEREDRLRKKDRKLTKKLHEVTRSQAAEHHADTQALSIRQHAMTQLQADDHQSASRLLSMDHHNSSQEQSAAQHKAAQELTKAQHQEIKAQHLDQFMHNNPNYKAYKPTPK